MQIWNADSTRMIDNMLDISHFPYTHRGTFGIEQETVINKMELKSMGERMDRTDKRHTEEFGEIKQMLKDLTVKVDNLGHRRDR